MTRLLGRRRERGQSLVEFTLVVLPIMMTLTLMIAEMGVALGTNMTLIEATREGARVGAVLADGDGYGCAGYTDAGSVDPQIIAAVQRAIKSPGSGITLANIDFVEIYKSDANGNPIAGTTNKWTPTTPGSGTKACGVNLDFLQGAVNWSAAVRGTTLPVNSIGVLIQYRYQLFTPLAALTGLFGASQITMVNSTVMALEP